jgi:hypothetical protein
VHACTWRECWRRCGRDRRECFCGADDRDSGFTILTHRYLLCGCAIALWIPCPAALQTCGALRLCGVLILCIGDAFVRVGAVGAGVVLHCVATAAVEHCRCSCSVQAALFGEPFSTIADGLTPGLQYFFRVAAHRAVVRRARVLEPVGRDSTAPEGARTAGAVPRQLDDVVDSARVGPHCEDG